MSIEDWTLIIENFYFVMQLVFNVIVLLCLYRLTDRINEIDKK